MKTSDNLLLVAALSARARVLRRVVSVLSRPRVLAALGREPFAVVDAADGLLRREYDGGGEHGPKQAPAARLVHTSDVAVAPLPGGALKVVPAPACRLLSATTLGAECHYSSLFFAFCLTTRSLRRAALPRRSRK